MAAGDWLSTAGIGDANIAVASRAIRVALDASVKNMEIMGHPVVRSIMAEDQQLGQLMGALGVSTSFLTLGTTKLIAVAEGTEATPTDFSVANSTTVSPGRRAAARDIGDFGIALNAAMLQGDVNTVIALLSYDGLHMWFNDWLNRIVALASTATNTIGTTATALTWEELNEGVVAFKNRGAGAGPALGLLSAKGVNDLNADSLSLGGAFQFSQEGRAAIATMSAGAFVGSRNGVDWYLSSELDADGGDTLGMVLTGGAVRSKHQVVPLPSTAEAVINAGWYTVETRRIGGGISRYETVSHNAVGILEQARFAAVRYVTV